jgi:hypothetical protein
MVEAVLNSRMNVGHEPARTSVLGLYLLMYEEGAVLCKLPFDARAELLQVFVAV